MPAGGEKPGAPCGACRTLRRRCVPGCIFAPYFTAEDFAAVHGVFGASNASKMLEAVEDPEERRVAAATLIEEARARARDPTFGAISYLRILQEVNDNARKQVEEARDEIAREFGDLAAAEPVDVAAAPPEVRAEARAQVDAALKHAREQDARLLGVRKANEARWREMHPELATGTTTGNLAAGAGNGKGIGDGKRHRENTLSEKAMLVTRPAKQRGSRPPPCFPDERSRSRSHQQMAAAAAEAGREKAMLMRQPAPAEQQHGHHHLGKQNVPVVYGHGHGQPHQQMPEATRSVQAPAAAPGQPPRHGGDAAAGRTPGRQQGSTSVLLEAMMQLAGAGDGDGQQQHLVAQHAEKEHDISQEMLRLQELFDMAELARKQQMMKNDVLPEMAQWDAAAGVATEQDVTTTTTTTTMQQQIPANTWQQQHQYPAPHYAQEMPRQMEEASTPELAQTATGNMSFAWAAHQYHDAAAAHHASPWHHQLAEEAHQRAASQVAMPASEQDMLLLLQQNQIAAAESLSAGGARQFDSLAAAQYDGTELTLGYGGHPDMHQQQQVVVTHGNGHPGMHLLQELAAMEVLADERAMIRKQQGVTTSTTGMGQWDPDGAWFLEKLRQMEKEPMPDLAKRWHSQWQAEARHAQNELEQIGNGHGHPDGSSSAHQGMMMIQQAQESFAMTEMERKEMLMRQISAAGRAREQELFRKREMLMRQIAAAGRAREQELIAAQQAAAAAQRQQQYSGTELDISLGQWQGHPSWHQPTVQETLQEKQLPTVQQMLQEQQLADAVGFGGHQPSTTTSVQQAAAYANGEHGGAAGYTVAFLPPGSAMDAPFLVGQQPQPNGDQMDSPLSLADLSAQVSSQWQRTGQGLNSDSAAYLYYDSLSRHGLAGNGRFQQG